MSEATLNKFVESAWRDAHGDAVCAIKLMRDRKPGLGLREAARLVNDFRGEEVVKLQPSPRSSDPNANHWLNDQADSDMSNFYVDLACAVDRGNRALKWIEKGVDGLGKAEPYAATRDRVLDAIEAAEALFAKLRQHLSVGNQTN